MGVTYIGKCGWPSHPLVTALRPSFGYSSKRGCWGTRQVPNFLQIGYVELQLIYGLCAEYAAVRREIGEMSYVVSLTGYRGPDR